MDILRRYNYADNAHLDELLRVLDEGVHELKTEVDEFVHVPNPYRTRPQFLNVLTETLGFPRLVGLSDYDRRAVLIALGWAYHFRGSRHGLRLILRALWRYSSFTEDYKALLEQALVDLGPDGEANEAYFSGLGITPEDLTRITVNLMLDLKDSRRYGELQAVLYRQLLDIVRGDSGYGRIFATYRPGFDDIMPTLLGTSQFDGQGLTEDAFLLYGTQEAFLEPETQSILASLRWNLYPDIKLERSQQATDEFRPKITNLHYNILGYHNDTQMLMGSDTELTVNGVPLSPGGLE